MCNENEWIVREAFLAYNRGDVRRMLDFVHPDLEWTHVVLGEENQSSESQTCYGRDELEKALTRQADLGLRAELEEVVAAGEQVIVVMRTPGVDEYRHRQADDRTYDVVTVQDGRIVGVRGCRDRDEARSVAGIA
jgi:ketosteroid isomerase-like protein